LRGKRPAAVFYLFGQPPPYAYVCGDEKTAKCPKKEKWGEKKEEMRKAGKKIWFMLFLLLFPPHDCKRRTRKKKIRKKENSEIVTNS
jgi:hypothetical protein